MLWLRATETLTMATKNICDCPQPPGGSVACEPDQLAICRVRDGVAQGECIDPPDGMGGLAHVTPNSARQYHNWALEHITGQRRSRWDPITPYDEAILRDGVYRNYATGEEVRFRLPEELDLSSSGSATSSRSGSGSPAPSTPVAAEDEGLTSAY